MKGKSIYFILIAFLLLFALIMFLIFGIDTKKGDNQTIIAVGDNTTWIYQNKKWYKVSKPESYQKLDWKVFKVFEDGKNIGDYYLWHDDKWYVFDKNKSAVEVTGEFFAYRSNDDLNLIDFSKENISTNTYIEEVLKENYLATESKFTKSYKTTIDVDNDGIGEDFYVISNAFPMDFNPKMSFSIVFMVKDGKIYNLYKNVGEYNAYNGCSPEIIASFDADRDNTNEVLVSCYQYSVSGRIDMLYKFAKDEFKIIASNQ